MAVMTPPSMPIDHDAEVVNNEAWPHRTTLHISPPNGYYRTGYVGGTILSMHHYAPLKSSC
jgi:hypothetical protein